MGLITTGGLLGHRYDRWRTEGPPEGEEDRSDVLQKRVVANKARLDCAGREIRPGDVVVVRTWFTFVEGGPRTGYHKQEVRVRKGPAWEAS